MLDTALTRLRRLPPLVTTWEIETLKQKLARAASGELFLLQGGDCAESFSDCSPDLIASKLKILLQMSLVLVHGSRKPVVRVARLAGQYAKPRSSDMETIDGVTLPSYRGDAVNGIEFTQDRRNPDPNRMLAGYERAALTLNFVRALADGGFADLRHPEYWDLDFVTHSSHREEYQRIVESIKDAMDFMVAVTEIPTSNMQRAHFYTSHEGLLLHYEEAQTKRFGHREGWYNLSTHMPWIGKRTATLDGAHVEYFRGIRNPIGVKVGPGMSAPELKNLLGTLDPNKEPGRLTLIHRFGASKIEDELPSLIEAVQKTDHPVLWTCDPMHGNTELTKDGLKTRQFDNILREVELSFQIHKKVGSHLGGVHFEMTGEDVTECTGGARGLDQSGLKRNYLSQVDPRLNYEQALEMALRIASHLRT